MDRLLLFLSAAFARAAGRERPRGENGRTPAPSPALRTAAEILTRMARGSFRRPDGYALAELVHPRDPRDWDQPVASPPVFADALNLLLSTGDVVESGGRFLPSAAARALVDGLYPKVGLGAALEEGVAEYLRKRPRGGAVRFAPGDAEVGAAFAAHASRTGPL